MNNYLLSNGIKLGTMTLSYLFKNRQTILKNIHDKLRSKAGNVSVICIPRKCGKSYLCKKLYNNFTDKQTIILDIDDDNFLKLNADPDYSKYLMLKKDHNQNATMFLYLSVKNFITKFKQDLPNYKMIIITSDAHIDDFLMLKDSVYLCSSKSFFESNIYPSLKEEEKQN
jgi:hypothetical protein